MMRTLFVSLLVVTLVGCASSSTNHIANTNVSSGNAFSVVVLPSNTSDYNAPPLTSLSALADDEVINTFIYAFSKTNGQIDTIVRDVDYYRAIADLLWQYPDDSRLVEILKTEPAPLVLVSLMVEEQLQYWLDSPFDVAVDVPPKPGPIVEVAKPVLLRGEFESRLEFSVRLQQAQVAYDEAKHQAMTEYRALLQAHQDALDLKQQLENQEKSRREEARESVYQQLLSLALTIVLGDLFFVSADYDSDIYTLFLQLSSTRAKISRNLAVVLSPQTAELMVQQLSQVAPYVSIYENQNGTLVLGDKTSLAFDGQTYEALAVDYVNIPELTLRRVR